VTTPITRFVAATGAVRPAFGSAGELFFTADRTGSMQLWSRSQAAGERALTRCDRVGAYAPSPDGSRLAFAVDIGGSEHWSIHVMRTDGDDARTISGVPERVHHLVGWSADQREILAFANLRDERFFDLLAFPANGGEPREVLRHDGSGMKAAVLADDSVVISTHRDRLQHHHLLHVSRAGTVRQLTPNAPFALHDEPVAFGKDVLIISNRGRDLACVARVGTDGSFEPIVAADAEATAIAAKGERFAYELDRDGYAEIHIVDGADRIVAGHPPGALPSERIGQPLALGRDGSLAFALQRYESPAGIYLAPPGGTARLVVCPSIDGIDPQDLPVVELASFASYDGLRVPGFLLHPRGGGCRPTIIDLHGGPEAQSRPRWFPWSVALVAAGFNVFFPNVRGSSGYGARYLALDDVHLRMNAIRDVDAAAGWLAAEGIAPVTRIGVMGGSYGGFLALAAAVFFPERWAAVAELYGVSDYVAQFERVPPWRRPLREVEFGSLAREREFIASISPANFLDRMRAPLLVIHGANDSLVSIAQAERVVEPLRNRGHDVTYVRYENEGHGIAHAHNIADAVHQIVNFFGARL
jgi:dipeptidyl aminopeptidase/acylaminoacyl peptidase